jgi:acetyl-CoA synthetase (ADP-forming)
MVRGDRELIAGVATDPQFGPLVMLGVGGVLAEAVADVSVRLAPITELDAAEMIEDLHSQVLLGEFRGEPAIDRGALMGLLLSLSAAATTTEGARVVSADLNPLIVCDGVPVPVDALVELEDRP